MHTTANTGMKILGVYNSNRERIAGGRVRIVPEYNEMKFAMGAWFLFKANLLMVEFVERLAGQTMNGRNCHPPL